MITGNQNPARQRFDTPIAIYCAAGMREALGRAAEREMLSISAFIRRVLNEQLRADGVLEK